MRRELLEQKPFHWLGWSHDYTNKWSEWLQLAQKEIDYREQLTHHPNKKLEAKLKIITETLDNWKNPPTFEEYIT